MASSKPDKFRTVLILACAIGWAVYELAHPATFQFATDAYQWLLAQRRAPEVRRTVVVEIDPEEEFPTVSDQNLCAEEREFLASLIGRIAAANPAVIVIDKSFRKDACAEPDEGTRKLVAAITTAAQKHRIVVGLEARPLKDSLSIADDLPSTFLLDSLDFEPEAPPHYQEGLINVDGDTRHLPLRWVVRRSKTDAAIIQKNTLALSAATAFEPALLAREPHLVQLMADYQQPLVALLPANKWSLDKHYYASQVLCGKKAGEKQRWRSCKTIIPPPEGLSSQIVVIGEADPQRDSFDTVVGRLPGFYLQANYIEALLDSRYIRGATAFWNYLVAGIFLVTLGLVLKTFEHRMILAAACIAAVLAATCVFLYFMAVDVGIYIDPLPEEGSALIGALGHLLFLRGWPARSRKRGRARTKQTAADPRAHAAKAGDTPDIP